MCLWAAASRSRVRSPQPFGLAGGLGHGWRGGRDQSGLVRRRLCPPFPSDFHEEASVLRFATEVLRPQGQVCSPSGCGLVHLQEEGGGEAAGRGPHPLPGPRRKTEAVVAAGASRPGPGSCGLGPRQLRSPKPWHRREGSGSGSAPTANLGQRPHVFARLLS